MIYRPLAFACLLFTFFLGTMLLLRPEVAVAMSPTVSVERPEIPASAPLAITDDFTKTLAFSTYVDPDGFTTLYDIAVDSKGNSVAVGNTTSHSVTLVSPYQATWSCERSGQTVGVLFKFAPSGEEVLFSSYFGVGCGDKIEAVDVDAEGNIYIAGTTESDDFPLLNPLFSDPSGLRSFIAKFSPDGSQLLFSTILPRGLIADLAVSADGFVHIAGYTSFDDLPVKNALYPQKGGSGYDAFVGKLKGDGSELIYLTYLGGELQDRAESVAVGPDGSTYVTGFTYSDDFPTQNPIENLEGLFEAFVTHLSSDGTSLLYSTYLGGTDNTHGFAIDVDAKGNAYVVGHTLSDDFPTTVNAYMPEQPNQDWSSFVAKISMTGTLQYGTYYGTADGQTLAYGIAVDDAGFAYITGNVNGQQLPLVYPIQDARQGTRPDIFIAKFDPAGAELLLSTYMGSDGVDQGIGIAVDKNATLYVTGLTRSPAWPTTTGAYVETVTPINPSNYLNSYVARLTTLPWTLIIYSAYDNDLTFQEILIDALEYVADNPYMRILALFDRGPEEFPIFLDSAYYVLQKDERNYRPAAYETGVTVFPQDELDTSNPQTLVNFVTWARENYPSRYEALFLDDHGSGVSGALIDEHNGSGVPHSHMSVKDIGQALDTITDGGQDKIDILYMVACLMGMVEPAYEWRHTADYYVASEQIYLADARMSIPYGNAITGTISPLLYAQRLADGYADILDLEDEFGPNPYTISVADLSQMDSLHAATHVFADAVTDYLRDTPSGWITVSQIISDVQHFDSTGNLVMEASDEYVDLYDFASLVHTHIPEASVQTAAETLMNRLQDYIVYERSSSAPRHNTDNYWDHTGAHGAAIFLPKTPRSFYERFFLSFLQPPPATARRQGEQEDNEGWKAFLDTYVALANPNAADNPLPPPLLPWLTVSQEQQPTSTNIFLPILVR